MRQCCRWSASNSVSRESGRAVQASGSGGSWWRELLAGDGEHSAQKGRHQATQGVQRAGRNAPDTCRVCLMTCTHCSVASISIVTGRCNLKRYINRSALQVCCRSSCWVLVQSSRSYAACILSTGSKLLLHHGWLVYSESSNPTRSNSLPSTSTPCCCFIRAGSRCFVLGFCALLDRILPL